MAHYHQVVGSNPTPATSIKEVIMSEIRDKVKRQLDDIFRDYMSGETWDNCAKKILSIPELAIVDREAELPKRMTREAIPGDMARSMELNKNINFGYEQAQQDMRKAGWIREIKEIEPIEEEKDVPDRKS